MSLTRSLIATNESSPVMRWREMSWGFFGFICLLAVIGFVSLYSAANGNVSPWALRQVLYFAVGIIFYFAITGADIKWVHRLVWPFYIGCILLLVAVQFIGYVGMGAQRWLDFGFIKLQPSELMKLATIMALARYYHAVDPHQVTRLKTLLIPAGIIALPFLLIITQPNLGTGLTLIFASVATLFVAGVSLWIFIAAGLMMAAAVPIVWMMLHAYQKERILTFLNPESDPLGTGFHIMQSKIALGSGGFFGKGFLQGTQSNLNFLPEKHTDFIFTLWVEEWGMMGALILFIALGIIFAYGFWISMRCRHVFGRLMAFGLMVNYSVYVFVNVAMVMGLIPVVGIPFPLLSYGGTSLLAAMIGFALIQVCHIDRDAKLPHTVV
jgi:rod shape determining protein RodA